MAKINRSKYPPLDASGRAKRVAATQGRTPTFVSTLSKDEVAAIAALCDKTGTLAVDAGEKFAQIISAREDRFNKRNAKPEAATVVPVE